MTSSTTLPSLSSGGDFVKETRRLLAHLPKSDPGFLCLGMAAAKLAEE